MGSYKFKWGYGVPLGVVISMVISPLIWRKTVVTLLITPLIPTHEPPSRAAGLPEERGFRGSGFGG